MALNRAEILEADDLVIEEIDVPEWGGTVLVKALSGTERDAFEASMVIHRGKETLPDTKNTRAKLVARAIVDEDGIRMFSDEDVAALGKKSAAALNRVFEKAAELSGLDDDDVEVLEGNSDAAQSGDSTSS